MKSLTEQEYFELCQKVANSYYDLDTVEPEPPENSWIPSESPAKEKMKEMLSGSNGIIDLTDANRGQVSSKIHTCSNFKIGNFLLKISKYRGEPNKNLKVDIFIYEDRKAGNYGKISVKLDPTKDDRFQTRDWAGYFSTIQKVGKDIPIEDLPNIVRWIQAVQKMKAFL